MPSPSPFSARDRATLVGVVALFAIVVFEETAVVAALPSAARSLHSIGSFGWLYTGFVVAKIIGLAVAGQYSDRHGPRPVVVIAFALFVASLVVCGLAPEIAVLIAGRFAGGFADGLLLTAVYVIIGQEFTSAAMPKVQTAIGSSFVVPALLGPLLAGSIAQHLGWRWVFLGLAPLLVLVMALLLPALRRPGPPPSGTARRNTLPNAVAVGVAVALLEFAGQHPPSWPVLAATAGVAVALLAWGLRALLPVGTFRLRPGVAGSIGLRAVFGGAFLGADALIPLMMQLQHGYSPTFAALPLATADALWACGSWLQARTPRGDETRHRVRLIRIGFALTAVGTSTAAAVASPAVSGLWMFAGWCFAGLGAGLAYTTFNVLVLRYTTDADRGFDSAASQLAGNVGLAISSGLGGVFVAAAANGTLGFGTAFMTMNLVLTGVLVFGCTASVRLRAPAGFRPAGPREGIAT